MLLIKFYLPFLYSSTKKKILKNSEFRLPFIKLLIYRLRSVGSVDSSRPNLLSDSTDATQIEQKKKTQIDTRTAVCP